ncbi:MAG TPA: hypothetical protein VFT31_01555 [Kribbella sp.]|nr:hypothetical protein [Kribbella sp.]
MTRRRLVPAMLVMLTMPAGGCATGGGLRVEGDDPVTPTAAATPTVNTAPTPTVNTAPGPPRTPAIMTTEETSLATIRQTLLADDRLDKNIRTVLENCEVVERCLRRGVRVDVMHTGQPQQVVTVNTVDGFSFGGFLLALEPAGPRPVWSLTADQLKIYPSRQGDLVVESKVFGPNDQVCCPSGSKVEVYRWNGRQMTKLSEQYQEGD